MLEICIFYKPVVPCDIFIAFGILFDNYSNFTKLYFLWVPIGASVIFDSFFQNCSLGNVPKVFK